MQNFIFKNEYRLFVRLENHNIVFQTTLKK